MEGQGAAEIGAQSSDANDSSMGRWRREEEFEIQSGNGSGDDQPQEPPKKKKYHRHSPGQIAKLEKFFSLNPHPDVKERQELGRDLGLETKQIKFWFQNRRTQVKTQSGRLDNMILRQEHEKLKAENAMLMECWNNPLCHNCGGPGVRRLSSDEHQQLLILNALLKEELGRVSGLVGRYIGGTLPSSVVPPRYVPNFGGYAGPIPNVDPALMAIPNMDAASMAIPNMDAASALIPNMDATSISILGLDFPEPSSITEVSKSEKSRRFKDFAVSAMDELVHLVQAGEPLWMKSPELGGGGVRDVLNLEEYAQIAAPSLALKHDGFVTEASRETGILMIRSVDLVGMLMDEIRSVEAFSGLVANSSILEVISHGSSESISGTLHLMQADLQVISPLVPVRQAKFLRFCRQHDKGVWAVVDVSLDAIPEGSSSYSFPGSMRLPSGCVIQDIPQGYCQVTWVDHSEYNEESIHPILRPVIRSGKGFGARRWLSTLQRYCECLGRLNASSAMLEDQSLMTVAGTRCVLSLAHEMVERFCSGVVSDGSNGWPKWEKVPANVSNLVKLLMRKSIDGTLGAVFAVSTSVWLPVSRERLFGFLSDIRTRKDWDILMDGGLMDERLRIPKVQAPSNYVSLLRASNNDEFTNQKAILQEVRHDASGSLVVYAPVHVAALDMVINGVDYGSLDLLPSGFAILPDGRDQENVIKSEPGEEGGSILTVGFQILVDTHPSGRLSTESMEMLNNLLSGTIHRIKDRLQLMA